MKKTILFFFLLIPLLFSVFSCSQPSPTSTQPTPTPVPPLYIDNFEDNDYANLLTSQWLATAIGGASQLHYCLLQTGPNKNGAYALVVSATVQAAIDAGPYYYGMAYLNTGSTGSAVPADISKYNKLRFYAALCDAVEGSASLLFTVNIYGGTSSQASINVATAFNPVFKDYSLNLSDFTVDSGTLADLKSGLKQIIFNVFIQSPAANDTADIQFYIDDVRFTQ